MKKALFILYCVFCIFGLFSAEKCTNNYRCEALDHTYPQRGDICARKASDGSFVISQCSDSSLICDIYQTGTCIQSDDAAISPFPGGVCNHNFDCNSGKCRSGFCTGSQKGEKCNLSGTCDVGLYCNKNGECDYPKGLNKTCESHEECNLHLACNAGTCVDLFSVPEGSIVDEENDYRVPYQSLSCSSGWYYTNSKGKQVCAKGAPVIQGKKEPFKCEGKGDSCVYKFPDTNFSYSLECICGTNKNEEGSYYCPYAPSKEGNFKANLQAFTKTANHCPQIAKRGNWLLCGDLFINPTKWQGFIVEYIETTYWADIVDRLDCMKNTGIFYIYSWAQEGWSHKHVRDSADGLVVYLAGVSLLTLFALF